MFRYSTHFELILIYGVICVLRFIFAEDIQLIQHHIFENYPFLIELPLHFYQKSVDESVDKVDWWLPEVEMGSDYKCT